jgi:hypothetical protein
MSSEIVLSLFHYVHALEEEGRDIGGGGSQEALHSPAAPRSRNHVDWR